MMLESADLIESLSKALSEAEAERDYQTGFVQKLQTALAFWMPGVDLRLDEATRELAADDAYLLAGSIGERDLPCWGEGILDRALAAESRLAEATTALKYLDRTFSNTIINPAASDSNYVHVQVYVGAFRAARAFIAGNDSPSTSKEDRK
jgi:hypothetical protein